MQQLMLSGWVSHARTVARLVAACLFVATLCFVGPSFIWPLDSGAQSTRYKLDLGSQRIAVWSRSHGRLPTDAEGVGTVLTEGGVPKMGFSIGIDAWGHPVLYHLKSDGLRHCASVYSAGPNGRDEGGAGDDIVGSMAICE
jgi:hypothetical protein